MWDCWSWCVWTEALDRLDDPPWMLACVAKCAAVAVEAGAIVTIRSQVTLREDAPKLVLHLACKWQHHCDIDCFVECMGNFEQHKSHWLAINTSPPTPFTLWWTKDYEGSLMLGHFCAFATWRQSRVTSAKLSCLWRLKDVINSHVSPISQ